MVFASVQILHIPDGFLNLVVSLICWLVSLFVLLMAIRNTQKSFEERLVPLAGILAAFIFAGQMINFPVAGGTSGHLIGASLAAIVLGPWLGILVMTAVIALQALLFQDGGFLVMGANILVMGIVPVWVGYGVYRTVAKMGQRPQLVGAAIASWLSVMAAALITAMLLGFSGTTSFRIAVPALLGIHALIGIGEALIATAALSYIMKSRPELLAANTNQSRGWIIGGLGITLALLILSPVASSLPDGLEWVAIENDFMGKAMEAPFKIMPDYALPWLTGTYLGTILAGIVGTLAVAAIIIILTRLLRQKQTGKNRPGSGD